MAIENACILFNTIETPLIIDSTGAIVDFLLKFHKQQNPNQECQMLKVTIFIESIYKISILSQHSPIFLPKLSWVFVLAKHWSLMICIMLSRQ